MFSQRSLASVFWPKTFQHHLLLIYPAIKNKKRGEQKRQGGGEAKESVRERERTRPGVCGRCRS